MESNYSCCVVAQSNYSPLWAVACLLVPLHIANWKHYLLGTLSVLYILYHKNGELQHIYYLVIRSNAFNLQNYSPVSTLLNSVWYINHAMNSRRCIKSEVNDRGNLPGRQLVCWRTICFEWPIKHHIIIYLYYKSVLSWCMNKIQNILFNTLKKKWEKLWDKKSLNNCHYVLLPSQNISC